MTDKINILSLTGITFYKEFELHCVPTPWRSKKSAVRGKRLIVYSDKEQRTNEQTIEALLSLHRPKNMLLGPIELRVIAYVPIPASRPLWWHEARKRGMIKATKKPDADNYTKMIKDCMERQCFFKNDSQVFRESSMKTYSENPRWAITLYEYYQPNTAEDYKSWLQRPDD